MSQKNASINKTDITAADGLQNAQAGTETVRRYAMKRSQRNNWLRKYMSVVIPEDEAESVRRSSAGGKAARRRKAKILLTVLIALVAVVASIPLVKLVMTQLTVKNVEIKGECPYSAEQIAEAAGISEGEGLFSFDRSEAAVEASDKLTCLRTCKVSVKIPDTVVFTVTQEVPVIYTEIAGAYYSLSDSLKVLDRDEEPSAYEASGLVYADLPSTVSAVTGSALKFAGDTPTAYLTDVLNALEASGSLESVTRLYLSDRFNISAVYADRYLVRLGSATEIALKLATASRIIESVEPADGRQAVIDVSTPSASGLMYVESIDPESLKS